MIPPPRGMGILACRAFPGSPHLQKAHLARRLDELLVLLDSLAEGAFGAVGLVEEFPDLAEPVVAAREAWLGRDHVRNDPLRLTHNGFFAPTRIVEARPGPVGPILGLTRAGLAGGREKLDGLGVIAPPEQDFPLEKAGLSVSAVGMVLPTGFFPLRPSRYSARRVGSPRTMAASLMRARMRSASGTSSDRPAPASRSGW